MCFTSSYTEKTVSETDDKVTMDSPVTMTSIDKDRSISAVEEKQRCSVL